RCELGTSVTDATLDVTCNRECRLLLDEVVRDRRAVDETNAHPHHRDRWAHLGQKPVRALEQAPGGLELTAIGERAGMRVQDPWIVGPLRSECHDRFVARRLAIDAARRE